MKNLLSIIQSKILKGSLRNKILLGYVVPAVLMIIIGLMNFSTVEKVDKGYDASRNNLVPKLVAISEIKAGISGQSNDERGFLLTGSDEFVNSLHNKEKVVDEHLDKINKGADDEDKELVEKIEAAHQDYTKIQEQVVELYKSGKVEDAKKLSLGEGRQKRKSVDNLYEELNKSISNDIVKGDQELDSQLETSETISTVALISIIVLSLLAGYFIANKIVVEIKKLVNHSKQLATGDFSVDELNIKSGDEIEELAQSFNTMVKSIKTLLDEVLNTAHMVSSSSEEVSASITELTKTSQIQAASAQEITCVTQKLDNDVSTTAKEIEEASRNLETITVSAKEMGDGVQEVAVDVQNIMRNLDVAVSTIEQITGSIDSINDNSKEVSKHAEESYKAAEEGQKVVGKTVAEMEKVDGVVNELSTIIKELGSSASQIGEIINLISDVAEQTNLLALNAAIEAARAGENGKGFAVVADAIRQLAEKSSEATKDIDKLIKGIVGQVNNAVSSTDEGMHKVKAGVDLVKTTGDAFDKIYSSIKTTKELVSQIVAAIEEQNIGSRGIAKSVGEVSNRIQNLSAISEEQAVGVEGVIKSLDGTNSAIKRIQRIASEQSAASQDASKAVDTLSEGNQEVVAGIEEIASATEHLVEQSQTLINAANKFKLK